MSDFELLLLFLALVLFVSSLVFMFRWMAGSTNDFIGLFSVGGLFVSIAVPYIVVPDALDDAVKGLLSPFTKVVSDLSSDILSDAEKTIDRATRSATSTARQTVSEIKQETKGSWAGWFIGAGKKRAKKRA